VSIGALPSVPPTRPSWWLAEALAAEGHVPDCPALCGQVTADVAIVGGGYTGLWTALALKERRPDLAVVVIERDTCGAGASGMNGGKVHGYWTSLASMETLLGPDGALAVARAGARAQDGLRAFAKACGSDVWWREAPSVRVSAAPAQDRKLAGYVAAAKRLGVPDAAVACPQARCGRSAPLPYFAPACALPRARPCIRGGWRAPCAPRRCGARFRSTNVRR
jgi:glycine/D-amino acid oxidase-like deaminating enzyme